MHRRITARCVSLPQGTSRTGSPADGSANPGWKRDARV